MHGSPWAAVHLMKMARTVQEHIETIIYEDVEDFIRAAHISPVPAAHMRYYFGIESESDSDSQAN